MTQPADESKARPLMSSPGLLIGVLLALVASGLYLSARASAQTFEQAAPPLASTFAESGEEVQLGGVSGMAVNRSGAGGVPAGTVYAVSENSGTWVMRFKPSEKGGLKFSEAWEVPRLKREYERCGPESPDGRPCAAQIGGGPKRLDVEVDRSTGNVYVFAPVGRSCTCDTIVEYKADGGEEITRFGEAAYSGETTAESPGKVHISALTGGMAIDDSGNVYVFDYNAVDKRYRLMKFVPETPGDVSRYVYAGESSDVASGIFNPGVSQLPTYPVSDDAGNIYVAGETYVQEYDPAGPPEKGPICSFELPEGGITAMTVDPATGEPFFYTYRDRMIHTLSACDREGRFTETGSIEVAPPRDDLYALAFDPARAFPPVTGGSRPAGVLYGAAPGPVSGNSGKGEAGKTALGYIFAPIEENAPQILSESVAGVGTTNAELQAQINPKSVATRFVFQYLTDAAYIEAGGSFVGAAEAPAGGGFLGGGQFAASASAVLSGLAPDTGYRYRVLATNCPAGEPDESCEAVGPTQAFRTFPSGAAVLPDGRAYELVSPAQKNGGQVMAPDPEVATCENCKPGLLYRHFPVQSAPGGEAVLYEGTPFGPDGGSIENAYIARRTGSGWQTETLTPPLLLGGAGGYWAFSPDLSQGVLSQTFPSLSPEAPSEFSNLYRQASAAPASLDPLIRSEPEHRLPSEGTNSFVISYAGASGDLSHILFSANDALTAADPPYAPEAPEVGEDERNLYESVSGRLHLVNVAPGNAATIPDAHFGPAPHTISADGSHIFWSSGSGQVFVRIDGTETEEIEDPGEFLTASADGSKVLLSDGCLYELATKTCEDLTLDEDGVHQGGFAGVAGESEDLSHIYFVIAPSTGIGTLTQGSGTVTGVQTSTGNFKIGQPIEGVGIPPETTIAGIGPGTLQLSNPATASGIEKSLFAQSPLTDTANSQGAEAKASGFNLYAWHEGATTFVAGLDAKDGSAWAAAPSAREAEASPGGQWLSFLSQEQLTDFDNVGPTCEAVASTPPVIYGPGPCEEVYLYDAATNQLTCPSCNPTGTAPLGSSHLLQIEEATPAMVQPRYLTDSGRLYFDSRDALSPADTNGGAEDVYQYEPLGLGSCTEPGGCTGLISGGRNQADSNLVAVSGSGDDVFFTTADRLVSADVDELYDLYDARVGGGFPEPVAPGFEEKPSPAAPVEPSASSASNLGPGNVKPRGCKKGQMKKKGKCVKKAKPKKHQKKKAGDDKKKNKHKKSRAKHNKGGAK